MTIPRPKRTGTAHSERTGGPYASPRGGKALLWVLVAACTVNGLFILGLLASVVLTGEDRSDRSQATGPSAVAQGGESAGSRSSSSGGQRAPRTRQNGNEDVLAAALADPGPSATVRTDSSSGATEAEPADADPTSADGASDAGSAPQPASAPNAWPTPREEDQARSLAIQAALKQIEAQVNQHGGSWEAWAKQLKVFRGDLGRRGPGRISDGKWVFINTSRHMLRKNSLDRPKGEGGPIEAILSLDRQLKQWDIDLIVMPIPDKVAVYPDQLSRNAPEDRRVAIQMYRLMKDLLEADVEVINLYETFADWRKAHGDAQLLYHRYDTHWMNRGSQIAAQEMADRLQRYAFVQKAQSKPNPFVARRGLAPGRADIGKHMKEKVESDKAFFDAYLGIHRRDGQGYEDVPDSPVIITADSFGRIMGEYYSFTAAQVAYHIHMPVMRLQGMGSGPRIASMLADEGADYLKGRRVFVWTGVARQFLKSRWHIVDLPDPPK